MLGSLDVNRAVRCFRYRWYDFAAFLIRVGRSNESHRMIPHRATKPRIAGAGLDGCIRTKYACRRGGADRPSEHSARISNGFTPVRGCRLSMPERERDGHRDRYHNMQTRCGPNASVRRDPLEPSIDIGLPAAIVARRTIDLGREPTYCTRISAQASHYPLTQPNLLGPVAAVDASAPSGRAIFDTSHHSRGMYIPASPHCCPTRSRSPDS